VGLSQLTIKFYKVTPDFLKFKETNGDKKFKTLMRKVKFSFRNVLPTSITILRDGVFSLLRKEVKLVAKINNCQFIQNKDDFIVKQLGDTEFIESEKLRFQRYLNSCLDDTIKKEKSSIKGKVRRQYTKLKSKIYESSIKAYYSLGIGIIIIVDDAYKI
jgi:hypothetical protein